MKIWPIVAGVGLFYGSFYADGRIPLRESNPHPHIRRAPEEIDLPDRPVTKTPPINIFTKMLALDDGGTEWVFKENQMIEQETEGDIFDNDPAKKFFLYTIFHYADGPVNRDLHNPDLDDNPAPTVQPYEGNAPVGFNITFETVNTVAPPIAEDNTAVDAQNHAVMNQLPIGSLLALNNIITPSGGSGTSVPCVTMLVRDAYAQFHAHLRLILFHRVTIKRLLVTLQHHLVDCLQVVLIHLHRLL